MVSSDLAGLFENERDRLLTLVRRIVGNRATAEELVQDAFLNMLKTATAIEQPAPYLTRAARNLALNHLRHVRQGVELSLEPEALTVIADGRPSPESILLHRDELRRLLSAIAELPPRRREVFVLQRFSGLSYDEIAARLGISRNTVMVQMVRALADIERKIGDRTP